MKNIDRFVSNVSQCILQPLNVLILILTGQKSAWSQFLNILNITKHKDTEYNSYCLSNPTPYSHYWMFLWK